VTLFDVLQIGQLKPERAIPDAVLKGAQGLAIITIMKAGLVMTYKIGTGLVVARNEDGFWSAPSAIASGGLGWGAQVILHAFCQLHNLSLV
jgi:lipid-binding SYLF domain-containing protein